MFVRYNRSLFPSVTNVPTTNPHTPQPSTNEGKMSKPSVCCFDGSPAFGGLFALSGADSRIRIYEPPLASASSSQKGMSQGSLKATLKAAAKDISLSDSNVQMCWYRNHKSTSLGTIAVGHHSGKISVWDVTRGVSSTIAPSSDSSSTSSASGSLVPSITSLALSPDGQTLYATCVGSNTIDMYDVKSATIRKKIKLFSRDKASLLSESVTFALSPSGSSVACYVGGGSLKVLDVETGKKLRKFSVPASQGAAGTVLAFSPDGRKLLVGPSGVNAVLVCDCGDLSDKKSSDDDDENVVISLESPVASLSFAPGTSSSFAAVCLNGSVHAFADLQGTGKLSSPADGVVATKFHPDDVSSDRILVARVAEHLGLHACFETVNSRGMAALSLSRSSGDGSGGSDAGKGKRPADASPNINGVLGPGEQGGVGPSQDLTSSSKKARRKGSDADGEQQQMDEQPEQQGNDEPSIAERLLSLTQQLDDDSDDEEERESRTSKKSAVGSASGAIVPRAESLVTVLNQALISQDEAQLEVAFQCHDRSIIETTISQLNPASVMTLLTKLVARISKRPSRADALGIWIHVLLQQHTSVFLSNELLSRRLGPLKNLLQERCETLPHLLQLDGRLSLLDFDFK